MNKKLLFYILLVTAPGAASAQSLVNEVQAAGGDHFTSANAQLSWTLGETVTETFEPGTITLTQGFQQTSFVITGLTEETAAQPSVYPVPSTGEINIDFGKLEEGAWTFTLYDATGRQLIIQEMHTGEARSAKLDLSAFASGYYLLTITRQENQNRFTYKITRL